MSIRDQAMPQRNRVYGVDEPQGARSSAASLSSNITGITDISGGSVATVTPDSYSRSRQPGQRRKRSRRRNSDEGNLEQSLSEIRSHTKNINVFEFLVEETEPEEIQTRQPETLQPTSEQLQFQPEQSEESEELQSKQVDLELELKLGQPEQQEAESPGLERLELEQSDPRQLEPGKPDFEHVQLRQPEFTQLQIEQYQPETIALDSPNSDHKSLRDLQVYKLPSQAEETDVEGYYRSQLSDSGISMGSSASDVHVEPLLRRSLPPLMEETTKYSTHREYPPYAASTVEPYYHHDPHVWGHFRTMGYTPEPILSVPAGIQGSSHLYEHTHQSTPEPPSMEEAEFTCLDSAPLIFREKRRKDVAQPHIFRSFAHLNARVLLQMQCNITDLEHELAVLDAKSVSADTHRTSSKGESHHSRHITKDQSLRADIYQELHTSLEQYYDTLSSFNQVKQMASPCDTIDVRSLKSWLQTHILPSSKIDQLMEDGTDLIRLRPCESRIPSEALRVAAYCILTNTFAPLLLFKLASSILSRLILLSLTTTITTLMLDRKRGNTTAELGDLYWQCIIGCAGVSFFAAIFL